VCSRKSGRRGSPDLCRSSGAALPAAVRQRGFEGGMGASFHGNSCSSAAVIRCARNEGRGGHDWGDSVGCTHRSSCCRRELGSGSHCAGDHVSAVQAQLGRESRGRAQEPARGNASPGFARTRDATSPTSWVVGCGGSSMPCVSSEGVCCVMSAMPYGPILRWLGTGRRAQCSASTRRLHTVSGGAAAGRGSLDASTATTTGSAAIA
jgi:hypothetical protein